MRFAISQRARSEFEFYRDTPLDMIGHELAPTDDPKGFSALECWWSLDTHGQELPCREPELLAKVLRGKQSVNLQVKLWAEDIADGMLLRQEELREYTLGWPAWVFSATLAQARKLLLERVGFVPGFAVAF